MTYVLVNDLRGLPCSKSQRGVLPSDKKWVRWAIKGLGLEIHSIATNGGKATAVDWSDLPEDTRIAYLQRSAGLTEQDGPDEALWTALANMSPALRERAARDHRALLSFEEKVRQGQGPTQATREVCQQFGISWQHVYNLRKRVEGVPRADWLPALAPKYKPGGRAVDMSDDAWTFFLSFLKESASRMGLKKAHRRTAKVAEHNGWAWPSYGTVRNRWKKLLTVAERQLIQYGTKALEETIPPMTRSVAHLHAMQIVNMDGRKADFFVRWEDGTVGRPICIAIQDVYSRCILGWRFAKTEDSDTTKAVILDVLDRHGLFAELKTDNSRAFASKKITGGTDHRFRGKIDPDEALGILTLIGVKVGFSKPRHGQSKPIERGFLDFAAGVDSLPEFKGAYCGNRPDAKPEDFRGVPVDIEVARAVYEREIREHNEQPGRRTEMGKGKLSLSEVFAQSHRQQPRRNIARAQRLFFMRDNVVLKPNKDTGALKKDGFTWWSAEHQDTLLKHRNRKVRVLFDPNDRSKPVMVLDMDRRIIVESLRCLEKGRFDNTEDARQYERGKRGRVKAVKADVKALNLMTKAQVINAQNRALAAQPAPQPPAIDTNVSAPAFGVPGVKAGATAPRTEGSAEVKKMSRDKFEANVARGLARELERRREAG